MKDEHEIVRRVRAAKSDVSEADSLISEYMPFIKSEASKFLGRRVDEDRDDELSIAMIAFHEAIKSYSPERGSFMSFAAMIIKSRLIDYARKEQRHKGVIYLDEPGENDEGTLAESLTDERVYQDEIVEREATRQEIEELTAVMAKYGVTLTDVAENCPKQERTLSACRAALRYAVENPEILDELLSSGKLPVSRLVSGGRVERKTLERHRKYMVALLLIYTNGFEILRGHLSHMVKGVSVK